MDTGLFFQENPFALWGLSHAMPVLIFIAVTTISIMYGKKLTSRLQKKKLLLALSLIPFFAFALYTIIHLVKDTYTIQNDLPIHICRVLALAAPIVYWKENKFWTGIFYFWILVGTFNAVIAADIRHDFPHWNYFVYFAMHTGLITLPLYNCIVLGHRIRKVDIWNAFWVANIFLLLTMALNFAISSNYMFTRHKPVVASMMDVMGPWPWYLVVLQFVAVTLFVIVYLPFWVRDRKEKKAKLQSS